MGIQEEIEKELNQKAKLTMPLWQWLAIGAGVLIAVAILFCFAVN